MDARIRVGMTGQSGFVGTHLSRWLSGFPETFRLIPFEDSFFGSAERLAGFISGCDVLLHLAAVNRCEDQQTLFDTNTRIAGDLVRALQAADRFPAVIYASSIREGEDNPYGQAKQKCREILENWAAGRGARLLTLRIPNVFGPGARPFDNSFIATFSHQVIHNEETQVTTDRSVPLLYIDSLCRKLAQHITAINNRKHPPVTIQPIEPDFHLKVPEVLSHLRNFHRLRQQGIEWNTKDQNLRNLHTTFLSHLEN